MIKEVFQKAMVAEASDRVLSHIIQNVSCWPQELGLARSFAWWWLLITGVSLGCSQLGQSHLPEAWTLFHFISSGLLEENLFPEGPQLPHQSPGGNRQAKPQPSEAER